VKLKSLFEKSLLSFIFIICGLCTTALNANATTLVVTSTHDDPDPPNLTLRDALAQAHSGDTVTFASTLNGQTILININRGSLVINQTLTVDASNLDAGITIDGNNAGGAYFAALQLFPQFQGAATVNLINLTITDAGYIYTGQTAVVKYNNQGTLNITDCNIVSNPGGGLESYGGHLNLLRTNVSNNTSTIAAGLYSQGNTSTAITDCTISQNVSSGASGLAGGIASAGPLTMSNTTVSDNSVSGLSGSKGGGIYISAGAPINIDSCTITGNTADQGGGIYTNVEITLTNSNVSFNTAHTQGGAITNINGALHIANCQICNNVCEAQPIQGPVGGISDTVGLKDTDISSSMISGNQGLGIAHGGFSGYPRTLTLNDCQISSNTFGGLSESIATTVANRCTFDQNSAPSTIIATAGGILNQGGNVTLNCSTISNNTAPKWAGIVTGLVNGNSNAGSMTLNDSTVSGNNSTSGDGAGVAIKVSSFGPGANATINNCTISGNQAPNGTGGGIYLDGGTTTTQVTVVATTITGNLSAAAGGGGIYVRPVPTSVLTIDSSIVALDSDGQNIYPDVSGSVVSSGYNVVGKVNGSSGWIGLDQTGDTDNPLDPVLGPLADNGGLTQTHALLPGSPAIDHGDPTLAGTPDQRGFIRDDPPDSGSYEAGPTGPRLASNDLSGTVFNTGQFPSDYLLRVETHSQTQAVRLLD